MDRSNFTTRGRLEGKDCLLITFLRSNFSLGWVRFKIRGSRFASFEALRRSQRPFWGLIPVVSR